MLINAHYSPCIREMLERREVTGINGGRYGLPLLTGAIISAYGGRELTAIAPSVFAPVGAQMKYMNN